MVKCGILVWNVLCGQARARERSPPCDVSQAVDLLIKGLDKASRRPLLPLSPPPCFHNASPIVHCVQTADTGQVSLTGQTLTF